MTIFINYSPSDSDEVAMKVKYNRIPITTERKTQAFGINDTRWEPLPTKISSPICKVITSSVQSTHLTIPHHIFVTISLDLSDMNSGPTLFANEISNKGKEDYFANCGISSSSTVHIHGPRRGGSREDVLGQWTCGHRNALRCCPARKRCDRYGELRMDAPKVVPPRVVGPLGKTQPHPLKGGSPTVSVKQQRPWAHPGKQFGTSPGAGVGPFNAPESDDAAAEMVRALQLLQSVMSAEDFSKYEKVLAPPK